MSETVKVCVKETFHTTNKRLKSPQYGWSRNTEDSGFGTAGILSESEVQLRARLRNPKYGNSKAHDKGRQSLASSWPAPLGKVCCCCVL